MLRRGSGRKRWKVWALLNTGWALIRNTTAGYIQDEAMTRGAAIACYTMFSLAPLLVVAIAIAGLAFGEDAVQGALAVQLSGLVGREGAEAVQAMVLGASRGGSDGSGGAFLAVVGLVVLLVTASGVFAEIQSALNIIWKNVPQALTVSNLLKARLLSIGLVATTGFLMLVSLLASTALSAFHGWALGFLPGLTPILHGLNFAVSFAVTAALLAAIYKVLPDRWLRWRDVTVGALGTALLFTVGKTLIGWYLGGSGVTARYGAAGALVIVLLWIY